MPNGAVGRDAQVQEHLRHSGLNGVDSRRGAGRSRVLGSGRYLGEASVAGEGADATSGKY
jgi:hypothetical protein